MSRQQRLLQRDLSSEDSVETASAVMVERKVSLEKGYRRALVKAFQTHPHQVDFTKPKQAIDIINEWVSDHTAGDNTIIFGITAFICMQLSVIVFSPRRHPRLLGIWISN